MYCLENQPCFSKSRALVPGGPARTGVVGLKKKGKKMARHHLKECCWGCQKGLGAPLRSGVKALSNPHRKKLLHQIINPKGFADSFPS